MSLKRAIPKTNSDLHCTKCIPVTKHKSQGEMGSQTFESETGNDEIRILVTNTRTKKKHANFSK